MGITSPSSCSYCHGRGTQMCGTCGGSGYVYHAPHQPSWPKRYVSWSETHKPCPRCQSRRHVTCTSCGGSGRGR